MRIHKLSWQGCMRKSFPHLSANSLSRSTLGKTIVKQPVQEPCEAIASSNARSRTGSSIDLLGLRRLGRDLAQARLSSVFSCLFSGCPLDPSVGFMAVVLAGIWQVLPPSDGSGLSSTFLGMTRARFQFLTHESDGYDGFVIAAGSRVLHFLATCLLSALKGGASCLVFYWAACSANASCCFLCLLVRCLLCQAQPGCLPMFQFQALANIKNHPNPRSQQC